VKAEGKTSGGPEHYPEQTPGTSTQCVNNTDVILLIPGRPGKTRRQAPEIRPSG